MAQSSYTIANVAGAAFRAAINTLAAALKTGNSGATAPSDTAQFLPWFDTATGLWKIRNAADSDWLVLGPYASPMPRRGYLSGMALSNNATDATNDIDIAAGECADSTNATVIRATASMTKRLDAAWAAGTGNGGLDTGAIANTTYHVYAIQKDSDGSTDYLFSASATSPTMPSGYTYFRRIGSILRESAAIVKFYQDGDVFIRDVQSLDYSQANPGTSRVTVTLKVPVGIVVEARLSSALLDVTPSASTLMLLTALEQTDIAPSGGSVYDLTIQPTGATAQVGVTTAKPVRTNTSGQVGFRLSGSNADITVQIYTCGWVDTRGRS